MRTVYINGNYVAENEATVSIFDRGLLFADAVYEVVGVWHGKLLDFDYHMERLSRSLAAMGIDPPLDRDELLLMHRELVHINHITNGMIYLQVTRGAEDREFVPSAGLKPTVFAFTQQRHPEDESANQNGVRLKSCEDLRWARRDIKTVGLMGQVFAKQQAHQAGAAEALLVSNGVITECASSSFFIIKDGLIITRPLSREILPGVTRRCLLEMLEQEIVSVEQRNVTLSEALQADEAFMTGASTFFFPVIAIDDHDIGTGKPGALTLKLQQMFFAKILEEGI